MTGDREKMAPEMTPQVDPAAKTQPAEGGRDEVDERADPAPGEVPGPGTNVEGRSRIGVDGPEDRPTEDRSDTWPA